MHKSTRFKSNPDRLFDCYCEVSTKYKNSAGTCVEKPWIKRRFPDTYRNKEILDSVPKFAYPCKGYLSSNDTVLFSFVLTNVDSKWTFGYCHRTPATDTCIVLLSQLPWHDAFFKIVTHLGTLFRIPEKQEELLAYLKALYQCKIDEQISIQFQINGQYRSYTYDAPDKLTLPSIPQDRNLTEYHSAVNVENMINLFASALNERHILITSRDLYRLSACVQALNTLLYPMHWQHIFIPVLPSDLLAYLQAPMPFMIGVPEPTFKKLKISELHEAVIFFADENIIRTSYDDVKDLPHGIVSSIKNDLKNQVAIGDSVSRAFLRALVRLIGGYREALEFNDGEKITFNHDRFIATRTTQYQSCLKRMLELQMFRQFIEGRLEMLNAGQGFNDDFELEVNLYEERTASRVNLQYAEWLNDMKTKSGVLIRSINPSLKLMYRGIKDKSKQAYKDWRVKVEQGSSQAQSFFYSRME